MYKFATDSYLCLFFHPFNSLTGELLTVPGESPGTVTTQNEQEVVAQYLAQLGGPYLASIEGRLTNNTAVSTPLNLVETEKVCAPGTFWNADYQSCFTCPSIGGVVSLQSEIQFEGISKTPVIDIGEITIQNDEMFSVRLVLKSKPPFISYSGSLAGFAQQQSISVDAGSTITLGFSSSSQSLSAGIATGDIVFGISDGTPVRIGCIGDDLHVDVALNVLPTEELNYLGSIKILGYTMTSLVFLVSVVSAGWCTAHRRHQIVKAMQVRCLALVADFYFSMPLTLFTPTYPGSRSSYFGSALEHCCLALALSH